MNPTSDHTSGTIAGALTSAGLFIFSCVPEVPHIVSWMCAFLSATASYLTIRKLSKTK